MRSLVSTDSLKPLTRPNRFTTFGATFGASPLLGVLARERFLGTTRGLGKPFRQMRHGCFLSLCLGYKMYESGKKHFSFKTTDFHRKRQIFASKDRLSHKKTYFSRCLRKTLRGLMKPFRQMRHGRCLSLCLQYMYFFNT